MHITYKKEVINMDFFPLKLRNTTKPWRKSCVQGYALYVRPYIGNQILVYIEVINSKLYY